MEKPKSDYLLSVQLLRGIASFMVLLCHSTLDIKIPEGSFVSHLRPLGAGVDTFLVISGFIIPYSMFKNNYKIGDFKLFMSRRLVRLEPPYIISIIFILLLNYANTLPSSYHGPAYSVNWGFTLRHLAYINAFTGEHWLNWSYWTLAVEFQFYLLLSVAFPLITNSNKTIMFTTFFALLLCCFISVPGRLYLIFYFLPLFLMGISLFLFMCEKVNVKEFYFLLVPTYFVYCLACYVKGNPLIYNPLDFIVSIGALPCIYYIKKVPKAFLWLGSISYSLYLIHGVLTTRFMALFEKYAHLGFHISWFLCIGMCIVSAYIYCIVFEKPFLRLSKKIRIKH